MKKRIQYIFYIVIISCLLIPNGNIKADTIIYPNVSISIFGEEIIASNENEYNLIYDAEKNDSDNPYHISYQAELDMLKVWNNYQTLKFLYLIGNSEEQWREKNMQAEWVISGIVDKDYVTVDANMLTKEACQARFEELNADTDFFKYIKCYSSEYNQSTGEWVAKFRLETDGKEGALAYLFETIQPSSLKFTTPYGMLYVKQSDFREEKSFLTTEMKLTGSLTIEHMYFNSLPIKFSSPSVSKTVNMVNNSLDEFNIVDDYKIGEIDGEDRIIMIPRTGETNESADTSYFPTGKYESNKNLTVEFNQSSMDSDQISAISWEIKGAGGYSDNFANSVITINNGEINVKANRAGVVELIGTYKGCSSSIYIVIPGDANRDELVNSRDLTNLIGHLSEPVSPLPNDQFTFFTVNMNGDNDINSRDSVILRGMCDKTIIPTN